MESGIFFIEAMKHHWVKAFILIKLIMQSRFCHYLFYKPYQVMSQFSAMGSKKTLNDFFSKIEKDIYPVGRLDYDSEGLLFLTNDKKLNHKLLHPNFVHEREYWVQVEGIPNDIDLDKLRNGVSISINGKKYHSQSAKGSIINPPYLQERIPPIRYRKSIPDSWLSIILTEGKNRQVRKMTAAVGFPTLRLVRYRIGALTLKEMKSGEIFQLNDEMTLRLFHKS